MEGVGCGTVRCKNCASTLTVGPFYTHARRTHEIRQRRRCNERRVYTREITRPLPLIRPAATVGRDKNSCVGDGTVLRRPWKTHARAYVSVRDVFVVLYRTFSPHVERRRTFKMKQNLKTGLVEFCGRPSGNLPNSYTCKTS